MKFDDLDRRMRIFETSADQSVLPGLYMVARLDGRSFTRLTKDVCQFEAPFDVRFRDMMVATTAALMKCGFHVLYGYTVSDEISLLLDRNETIFGRKIRKYDSTLAGEASAQFSIKLGRAACFDCRISQLPSEDLVVDYFRWRSDGLNEQQATRRLMGLSLSDKNELLFQHGINVNALPKWQKRGVGLYWEEYNRVSINPMTNDEVSARRRRIRIDPELTLKESYSDFIRSLLYHQRLARA